MDLSEGRTSRNVEDRRGRSVPGGLKLGGCGTLIVALVLLVFFGKDSLPLLESLGEMSLPESDSRVGVPGDAVGGDSASEFVSKVLADTEDTWAELFRLHGGNYQVPTLVLFDRRVESACGFGSAAVGPFYCPGDDSIYLDLSFFAELERLGGTGDFAQAYVLAHEVGHHVQNQLGIFDLADRIKTQLPGRENEVSMRLELQADCLAGVWAHHGHRARGILEPGDLEEGLTAAAAIGDDRLSRMTGGTITPDSFTHGTSSQRAAWLKRGLEQGTIDACNTFSSTSFQ